MTYEYSSDRLVIKAGDEDKQRLRTLIEEHMKDYLGVLAEDAACRVETQALEPLVCNSELGWVRPEEIAALTSAPILGVRDSAGNVKSAWGYMDYHSRSFVEDLLETGEAVFV